MTDPKEPLPSETANEKSGDDFFSELAEEPFEVRREHLRRQLTFRLSDLPAVDHGITVGHPPQPR